MEGRNDFVSAFRLSTNWPDRAKINKNNLNSFIKSGKSVIKNGGLVHFMTKRSSTVPSYADELLFAKSDLIFESLLI